MVELATDATIVTAERATIRTLAGTTAGAAEAQQSIMAEPMLWSHSVEDWDSNAAGAALVG